MQRVGWRTMMMRENVLAMSARDRRPFVYSQRRSIAREEFSKAGLARPDS